MKILTQSLILLMSFGSLFIWEQTGLSDLTIEAIALLIVLYLTVTFYRRKKHIDMMKTNGTVDIFILNSVIMLLIFKTGALYSPIYFLVYFLAFGITFIFEPLTVFVFTIGAVLLFLPEALKNGALESYIKIGSILIICPLAYFFGQSYKDREAEQADLEEMADRAKDTADTISKDVEEVIKKEEKNLGNEEMEKLNEILEETENLRGETKE